MYENRFSLSVSQASLPTSTILCCTPPVADTQDQSVSIYEIQPTFPLATLGHMFCGISFVRSWPIMFHAKPLFYHRGYLHFCPDSLSFESYIVIIMYLLTLCGYHVFPQPQLCPEFHIARTLFFSFGTSFVEFCVWPYIRSRFADAAFCFVLNFFLDFHFHICCRSTCCVYKEGMLGLSFVLQTL